MASARVIARNAAKKAAKRAKNISSDIGTAQLLNEVSLNASSNVFNVHSPVISSALNSTTRQVSSNLTDALEIAKVQVEASANAFGSGGALGHKQSMKALNLTKDVSEDMAKTAGKNIQQGPQTGFWKALDESPVGQWFDDKTGLSSMGKNLYQQTTKQGGPGIFKGFGDAAEKAGYYTTKESEKEAGKRVIDQVSTGKIAGAYLGISAGARIVTGGGLYKDNQGNTNIAGIPFI